MKQRLAFIALTGLFSFFLFVVSAHGLHAQTSGPIAGDSLCGSSAATECNLKAFKTMATKVFLLFVTIGSVLLVVFIAYRFLRAWWAYSIEKKPAAIKEAGEKALNSLIGFLIVVAVFGGAYYILLKALGTQDWAIKLLKLFSDTGIEHAYAQEKLLPNPLGSNSAYDIIMSFLSLVVRFFIYPAIIAMWVASGFKFVVSQGNPEGLKTARGWLLYTFLVTVIIFSLQGLVLAFRSTADKITGSSTTASSTTTDTTQKTSGPAPGTPGAVCQKDGYYGQIGADGQTCYVGGGR